MHGTENVIISKHISTILFVSSFVLCYPKEMISVPNHSDEHIRRLNRDKFIYNCKYMAIYWIFFSLETVSHIFKFGPLADAMNPKDGCKPYDINYNCMNFLVYGIQFVYRLITIFFIWFKCDFCSRQAAEKEHILQNVPSTTLGRDIKHRFWNCDQLLFPLAILAIMLLMEIVILFVDNKSIEAAYMVLELFLDMFKYLIWFTFAFVPRNVLSELRLYFFHPPYKNLLNNQQRKMLFIHMIFIPITIGLCFVWFASALVTEDFNFSTADENKVKFIRVILANLLILLWIRCVIYEPGSLETGFFCMFV